VLDTINSTRSSNTPHALAAGQRSASSIHRHCITSHTGDYMQRAVPHIWASALTLGYHTSLCIQSSQKEKEKEKGWRRQKMQPRIDFPGVSEPTFNGTSA